MRLHILGVCGTFMSGVALLAKSQGHSVTGSDEKVYPPISTQLAKEGITLLHGYDPAHIDPGIDAVIVGNVIKRGNQAIEYILSKRIPYISGPQWLAEQVLCKRQVIGVAGTHGKTTTTSLVTFILDSAGLNPGFLIGGIPQNFGVSARLGQLPYFVLEADEYDSAFFDKRSKFIHYRAQIMVLNNLEYDHADIFPNLRAIKQQFHYMIRTIANNGRLIVNAQDRNLKALLQMGCYTPVTTFAGQAGEWRAKLLKPDGSIFQVSYHGKVQGEVHWDLLGQHNVDNALAALAVAEYLGVNREIALQALQGFKSVKRRLEIKGCINGMTIYDDFAHHPTAIAKTLTGLRARIGKERLIALVEFGSYTMRSGVHKKHLAKAFQLADQVVCKRPTKDFGLEQILQSLHQPTMVYDHVDEIIKNLLPQLKSRDHIVILSNSGFDGISQKLLTSLAGR